ncbi:MAG: polysaccharide biosynthesis PFTS motif protein [Phycisphaerae bacterium]
MVVVLETFRHVSARSLRRHLDAGAEVYWLEPFVAIHHREGPVAQFPTDLVPNYVEPLRQAGRLKMLPAGVVDPPAIYWYAAEQAVETVEQAYPAWRRRHADICRHVAETLGTPVAETPFKRRLCEDLADFYSVNEMLHGVSRHFAGAPVCFYPSMDAAKYLEIRALLAEAGVPCREHPNVTLARRAVAADRRRSVRRSLLVTGKLLGQVLGGLLLGWRRPLAGARKAYRYGMTVVSPIRQLADSRRGPDFLVDGRTIRHEEVVLLPLVSLTPDQRERLGRIPCDVADVADGCLVFSHGRAWRRLLGLALTRRFLRNGEALRTASNVLYSCFLWERVLERVSLRHLVTHCDFNLGHVGRNIALGRAGVETWYFNDSMNYGCNWATPKSRVRHPFWTYLHYDHFIVWDEQLGAYFRSHPGTEGRVHVVGCLWASHGRSREEARRAAADRGLGDLGERFVVAVFDTTYGRNSLAAYEEGIAFAEHVLRLVEECPEVHVLLKEKKERSIHPHLEPDLGPRLLVLYDRMAAHPRIRVASDQADASELISLADLVVSFPFTATTYEALSANRPAVWHDPTNRYADRPYAQVPGLVTRSYEELRACVREAMRAGGRANPVPLGSPLLDPFRDGGAVERFRRLLAEADGAEGPPAGVAEGRPQAMSAKGGPGCSG